MPKAGKLELTLSDEYCKEVAQNEALTHLFVTLGYANFSKIGDIDDDDDAGYSTKDITLHRILQFCGIHSVAKLYYALMLAEPGDSLGVNRWAKDLEHRQVIMDILQVARYFMSIYPKRVKATVSREDIIYSHHSPYVVESTSGTLKTDSLPKLSNCTGLSWFTWKDTARAKLEVMGMAKVIDCPRYASQHPRQNAAVDGLLKLAIMSEKSASNLTALADSSLNGDGFSRWKRLEELNENKSMIRTILKQLRKGWDKLRLEKPTDYESFSGTFFILKDRISYMLLKGTEAGLDDLSEFEVGNPKAEFCRRVSKLQELEAETVPLKKDGSTLSETHMELKAVLIDKDLLKPATKESAAGGKSHVISNPGAEGGSSTAKTPKHDEQVRKMKQAHSRLWNAARDPKTTPEVKKLLLSALKPQVDKGGSSVKKSRRQKRKNAAVSFDLTEQKPLKKLKKPKKARVIAVDESESLDTGDLELATVADYLSHLGDDDSFSEASG